MIRPCPLCGLPMEVIGDGMFRAHKCAALQDIRHETLAKLRYGALTPQPLNETDEEPPCSNT